MNEMQHILTVSQVADLMGCSIKSIEERARCGDLPGLLWGDGGWVFPAEAFYARVNELAIEQAAARRKTQEPAAVAARAPRKAGKAPPILPTIGRLRR